MDPDTRSIPKTLTPEAERALAEAEERRRAAQKINNPGERVNEIGGPMGPEPTRFGDWERGGRAIDF